MSNILYAYGTLRPGNSPTYEVKGVMFNLGPFPGVKLGGDTTFICEKLEVEDWAIFDRYEGYFPDNPDMSLYVRKPYKDGFIYEFNRDGLTEDKIIKSGDWLLHKKVERYEQGNCF